MHFYTFSHMLLQRGWHTEGHVAELAVINVFALPAVGLHMASKLAGLCTSVAAQMAFVRLLTRV